MHTKSGQNREELMMLSLDLMVSADNSVRLIDLICKKFISDNPWREEWKGTSPKGCKSYPPEALSALLVYGYFNQIKSSRHLEKETHRNLEVMWLMEGLQPDYWTICAFRRTNKILIKELLRSFRAFLLDNKYASAKRLAFDGSKFKAYASRKMLDREGIKKKLENLDKSIEEYLSLLENNDSNDDKLEGAQKEIAALKEQIKRLEKQKSEIEAAGKTLDESGKNQISLNDKDAVLVNGREGKFSGYNGQTGVDTKGHFLMHNEIQTEANDLQQLENCVNKAEDEMGREIEEILADKGYGDTSQILNIENKGKQCFVPLPETKREKEQKSGIAFNYDEQNDFYICIQGKKLTLHAKNVKHSGAVYNIYKCYECDGCPTRDKCTKSKTGRTLKRNINQKQIDQYKEKLTNNYSRQRIAERKKVVEHPFGTIKWMMGKFNFLLTGKEKVQIEYDLYATAYNLKRLLNSATMPELKEQIMKFNWAIA